MKKVTLTIVGNFLPLTVSIASKKYLASHKEARNGLVYLTSALKSNLNAVKLFLTGLSTQLTRWWIKHPLTFPRTGNPNNLFYIIRLNWLVINCIYTDCMNIVLGATERDSQRKRSHLAVLFRQCFAATLSTCLKFTRTGKSL